MKLRGLATLIIGLVVVGTSAISAYGSYRSSLQLVESGKQRELQNAANIIQASIVNETNKAAARATMIEKMPAVQEALRAGDRELLGKMLIPAFQAQRDQYGVTEGQFHHAPASSVLRLLGPTTFGEDLSAFREMVLATNRRQETQKGVEVGRQGLSIRGIVVIKDDKGPIGSFEVGMGFTTVLEDVKKIAGFEAGVFIDDALMSTVATQLPRPDAERVVGGQRNVEATNWQMVRPLVTSDLLTKSMGVVTSTPSIGGIDYGLTLVPVLDYKGSRIGSVVAVKSFDTYANQRKAALVNTLALGLLQAVLLLATVLVVLNSFLLRPIAALGDKIAALVSGNHEVDFSDLSGDDEIGRLTAQIEALKAAMGKEEYRTAAKKDGVG